MQEIPACGILTATCEGVTRLRGARLRTLAGVIGVMIGIASVITMISTGEIAGAGPQDFDGARTDDSHRPAALKINESETRGAIGSMMRWRWGGPCIRFA